jgi:ribosomal protein S6
MNKENESIVEDEINARVYEISYILVPTMSETQAVEKINSLKSSIATLGGSFISEEAPYMRDLSYEMLRVIKNINNRFDTGYFGWIKYELDAALISKIDKTLKLDEEVIRYLVVKADRNVNIITRKESAVQVSDAVNLDTIEASNKEATANAASEVAAQSEVVDAQIAVAADENVEKLA